MNLKELLKNVDVVKIIGDDNVDITDIKFNSNE